MNGYRRLAHPVLAHPQFLRFAIARFLTTATWQMMSVAVGWQVYALTHDALALGLVGLAQFLPFFALVLPAGQIADLADRRLVLVAAYGCEALCAGILLAFTLRDGEAVWVIYAALALFGAGRAFWMPTGQAMTPNLVPPEIFPAAVAFNSTLFQIAVIGGPAIGGLLYLAGPVVVYATALTLLAIALCLIVSLAPSRALRDGQSFVLSDVLEGLKFVFRQRVVLGAISLDLFAVLFGGATALLPIYAADVLAVGPAGLGALRTAPGIGAALTAAWLAWHPIGRHVGRAMFGGVAVFGIATLVFGASTSFWLSLVALACLGAGDMVSVFIRHLLVQLETPDGIRGRVSAVNAIFIGASNELGEFESGATARLFGLVPAVLFGGAATLLVVALYLRLFPELRTMDAFPQPRRNGEEAP
ncbi:MAG: MFS transporter [Gammaproteobacteria bacterium]|nr:MFS transporter [Gammaproteobacteria bacterium]MBI5617818.1 MFS transporter [Gammaproteobacteria bacterium]